MDNDRIVILRIFFILTSMCLIAFAYKVSPEYPLILVANREEFYDRPTEKAHFWKGTEEHRILAGKDLKAGGTWFGVSENGKWAAVTNHRDMRSEEHTSELQSRPHLVCRLLL